MCRRISATPLSKCNLTNRTQTDISSLEAVAAAAPLTTKLKERVRSYLPCDSGPLERRLHSAEVWYTMRL
jgi:hypothetical protein